ncbi:MAG: hybrid sensor histidine kinase/response regulator [Anaerolineae bacterium]|nr:MAG: hybrid sensor histidine kinase/response regulator [Anaerolineae bacterium]
MTKILLIEDDKALLDDVLTILRFEGYEVLGAPDGGEGVRLAREHLPDLIISDVMMPVLDGYGVLLALQADPATSKIPFIFLTAKAASDQVRLGMHLGADDYLPKPFTNDDLLNAVRARLARGERVRAELAQRLGHLRESIALALPHELRTPLTSLVGFAELLMLDSQVMQPVEVVDMADAILKAGARLRRQLENFLLYAQVELCRQGASPASQCTGTGVENAEKLVCEVAQQQVAEHHRADDLTVDAKPAAVGIVRLALRKIVAELVDNACKFSEAGTPIHVRALPNEDHYLLQISDRGCGMTPEQIRQVSAFVQFDRRLREQQGTGLGLTLSRELASFCGGTLEIESQPGQGTVVTVRLPLAGSAA